MSSGFRPVSSIHSQISCCVRRVQLPRYLLSTRGGGRSFESVGRPGALLHEPRVPRIPTRNVVTYVVQLRWLCYYEICEWMSYNSHSNYSHPNAQNYASWSPPSFLHST